MRLLLAIVLLSLVAGCVTETSGGTELKSDPRAALERRVELARQYIGRGDWENAKRNLEIASDLDANNAMVHEAFGLVYQSTGEFETAEKSFRRALAVDASFSRARNNYAAFLYARGRFAEAVSQFKRVTEDTLYSGRPFAFINLGMSHLQLAQKADAEAAFKRALTMDRRNPLALMELGYLRLASGDTDAASRYYGVYRTVVRQQPARGLMLGIRIAQAVGDRDAEGSYALALRTRYPQSVEYLRYKAETTNP